MCLVLAPTRELAQQIARVFDEAGKLCGVRCVPCTARAKYEQKRQMREGGGCAVILRHPRSDSKSFMNDGDVKLDRVTTLVLDERTACWTWDSNPRSGDRRGDARGPSDGDVQRDVAAGRSRAWRRSSCATR